MNTNRKLTILVIVYIISIMLLSFFGYIGNRDKEAADFALEYFSRSEIETGRLYFLYGMFPVSAYRIFAMLLLFLIASSGINQRLASRFSSERLVSLRTFISFALILLLLGITRFPFALFSGFYRKIFFGLMNTDLFTWVLRHISSTLIIILAVSISLSLFALIIKKTKRYILYIPVAFFLLNVLFSIVYPRLITPMFYETSSIENDSLKLKIIEILKKEDIDIQNVYVVDKGRYSSVVNAYMTGLKYDRKIYLYDTLLKNFTDDEILSVVGHELGHYIEEHMLIGILLASIGMMLALPLMNFLSKLIFGKDLRGMVEVEGHAGLFILLILILFISKPVENGISRVMEKRADSYAVRITADPETFILMEAKIAKQNRSNVMPNPLYVWFYHSHPPALSRIKSAEKQQTK